MLYSGTSPESFRGRAGGEVRYVCVCMYMYMYMYMYSVYVCGMCVNICVTSMHAS